MTGEINLDYKAFDMYCNIPYETCLLNAEDNNRIFEGSPSFAKFTKIVFTNGDADGEKGGALFLAGDGKVSFIDSVFINNRAMRGGAIYISSQLLSVEILGSLFAGNQASLVRFFKL